MIRVILADDHAVVRRGLHQILAEPGDIEVVGQAAEYGELMTLMRDTECDVLVLDISMPGKSGMDTLKIVKERQPRLPVLILSMFPEDQYALRALKAGAAGYVTKDTAPERLVEAVRTAARGRKYVTPELAAALAERIGTDHDDRPAHETLSDREFETLKYIAAGRKLSEIAELMTLSPKTVSVYRARALEKLGVGSNAELAQYALRHKLLE